MERVENNGEDEDEDEEDWSLGFTIYTTCLPRVIMQSMPLTYSVSDKWMHEIRSGNALNASSFYSSTGPWKTVEINL